MSALRAAALAGLAAAVAGVAGCGESSYKVSGTVTFDGQPLPAGMVWFDPDPAKGNTAPQGFAYVKDGRYDTSENGRGVRPGGYVIRVEGFDGKPGNELPLGRPLFGDYREVKEIPAADTVLNFDVPKDQRARELRGQQNPGP